MDIKRASWISCLAYISSFVVGIFIAKFMDADVFGGAQVPTAMWTVSILFTIILVVIFSLWYFQDTKITADLKEGLLLGLVMVIVGFLFDIILFLPVLFSGTAADILDYYASPFFWLAIASVFAASGVTGWLKGSAE